MGMALTELVGTRLAVNAVDCRMTRCTEQESMPGNAINHPDAIDVAPARRPRGRPVVYPVGARQWHEFRHEIP